MFPDEPPTRPATGIRRTAGTDADLSSPQTDDPRTVIAGGWQRTHTARQSAPGVRAAPGSPPLGESRVDPVVGWLVVVDGPGKGSSITLGNGQNSLGRGISSRARIDFGDKQISRETHALVTYDPKHNRFYVQQGTGTNLTYLDGEPVLIPTVLESGSRITLGETTLRFVALCDESFTWQDSARAKEA